MGLDIKLPIGLMFSIIGVLLIVYGLATMSNSAMYEQSLGININLWWGGLLLVFGIVMMATSRKPEKPEDQKQQNQTSE